MLVQRLNVAVMQMCQLPGYASVNIECRCIADVPAFGLW